MFKIPKTGQTQAGFSLVELMIVVSLISVLALIGIPKYHSYKIKAYSVEAKSHLAGIYAAETAFFQEYSGYHHSLKILGYAPQGRNRYNAGFSQLGIVPANAPIENAYVTTATICSGPYGIGADTNCSVVISVPDITPFFQPGATVTATTFQAVAVASETSLSNAANEISNPLIQYVLNGIFEVNRASAASSTTATFYCPKWDSIESWTIDNAKQISQKKETGLISMTAYVVTSSTGNFSFTCPP